MTPTAYDLAHAAMAADPGNDALRLALYDRIADAELLLLLESEPQGNDIVPQVIETEEGEFVLAFDSEERLAEFASGPAPYAALPGRIIAQHLAGEGIGLGINLGVAESAMLLPPEAMDWLTETLTQAPQIETARPVAFAPPALAPAVLGLLLPAFAAKFAQIAGMAEAAVLAGATFENGARGHVLALLGTPEPAQAAVAKAMGEALAFSGLEAGELSVVFLEAGDPRAARILAEGLVLALPEAPAPDLQAPQESRPAGPGMDPARPPILR